MRERGVAHPYCCRVGQLGDWTHCPVCATAVEPEDGRFECPQCGYRTYAHSKPTASALLVGDGDRILLSKRGSEPFAGKWDLPGGFLEESEHPLDGLKREVREELGIGLTDERLLGIWIDRYGDDERAATTLNIYYVARIGDGTPEAADDVADLRWVAPGEVPSDELAFGHIEDVLSAWRNENA